MRTLRKLCRAAVHPIHPISVPVKAGQEPSERQAKPARHRCGRPIGAAGRAKAEMGPGLPLKHAIPMGPARSSHGSINRFRASRAFLSSKSARVGRQGARVPALHREPNPGVALQASAVLQSALADRRPVSAAGRMGVCFVSPFNILTLAVYRRRIGRSRGRRRRLLTRTRARHAGERDGGGVQSVGWFALVPFQIQKTQKPIRNTARR